VEILFAYLRYENHFTRKIVIARKGKSVLINSIQKSTKEYSKLRFREKSYWPYLALYTEIRGEILKGWILYDYHYRLSDPK
jgi:hypothetical protein